MTDTPDLLAVAERLERIASSVRSDRIVRGHANDLECAATILRKVHEARPAISQAVADTPDRWIEERLGVLLATTLGNEEAISAIATEGEE